MSDTTTVLDVPASGAKQISLPGRDEELAVLKDRLAGDRAAGAGFGAQPQPISQSPAIEPSSGPRGERPGKSSDWRRPGRALKIR